MAGPAGEAGEENQMTEEGFRVATGGGDLAALTAAEMVTSPGPQNTFRRCCIIPAPNLTAA